MERSVFEAPETPAPVFAFRAFKTALFGTPKQPDDENVKTTDAEEATKHEADLRKKDDPSKSLKARPINSILSPAKPQGILMTPGTTTTHRKSVSFGLAVKDDEGKPFVDAGKSGLPQNYPGKFPSPWTAKKPSVESGKKPTSLTRSLYEARDQSSKKPAAKPNDEASEAIAFFAPQEQPIARASPTKKRKQEDVSKSKESIPFNADATIDLNEPRSGSGQHWKSKYHRHHERNKEDIRNLLRYKELAKSYAKKKDAEKDELMDLLRQERSKVRAMENEISRLAGEIAGGQRVENEDQEIQSGLVKKLARKTAETLEYKRNVDDFANAMDGVKPRSATSGSKSDSTSKEDHRSKTGNPTASLNHMKAEVDELSKRLEEMTQASQKMESEKAKLSSDLSQVQEDLKRSEKRRLSQEVRHKKREERLEVEKQQLEKHFKKRLDLKQGGVDETEQLNAEIKTLKAQLEQNKRRDDYVEDSTEIERLTKQLRDLRHSNVQAINDYKLQIERLKAGTYQTSIFKDEKPYAQEQRRGNIQGSPESKEAAANFELDNEQTSQKRHDAREELRKSREQPEDTGPRKRSTLKSSRQRQPLLNIAKSSLNESRADQCIQSGPDSDILEGKAPIILHERSMHSESLDPILPSPENSFTATTTHEPQSVESNKTSAPSNVMTASSYLEVPIKEIAQRSRVSKSRTIERPETTSQQGRSPKSSGRQLPGTRLGLPPDRAAAAKARLKQRTAQRRIASGETDAQKENVRN